MTNDAPGRAALYNLTRNMAAVTEHANTRARMTSKHDISAIFADDCFCDYPMTGNQDQFSHKSFSFIPYGRCPKRAWMHTVMQFN